MSQLAPTSHYLAVKVREVKIERGNQQVGQITLYKYQEEVRGDEAELTAVDAPTGSGKTLAMLLAAEKYLKRGENALILYPTKALIRDQLNALKNLTRLAGIDAEVIAIDADALRRRAEKKGFKTHGEALDDMLSAEAPKIVLTNPDVVYYILRLLYKKGRTLLTKIFHVGFLGVDEVHLYWGISLQVIYTLINLLKRRKKLLTTATHDPTLIRLLSHSQQLSLIKAQLAPEGATVRQQVDLEVAPLRAEGSLREDREAQLLAQAALKALDEAEEPGNPKVVCIVNSLVFSEKLAETIGENEPDISVINSLTPQEHRRADAKIVVGTSAIEVGIDFDTQALIFEASDSSSFIQRLGRVARKRPGKALCITPYDNYAKLNQKLPNGQQIPYSQLHQAVLEAYPRNPSYADIVETPYGTVSQLGITHALTKMLYREKAQGVIASLKQLAEYAEPMAPPPALHRLAQLKEFLSSDTAPLMERLKRYPRLKTLLTKMGMRGSVLPALRTLLETAQSFEKMGVRGPFSSLPAYMLIRRGGETYEALTSVSVMDLNKLDFAYAETEEDFEKETGRKPPPGLELPVVIVRGVKTAGPGIKLQLTEAPAKRIFILKKDQLKVYAEKQELGREVARLLDGLPAYLTGKPRDWRLTALRVKVKAAERWLIIGPDALIEAWLEEER